jgi:hypothetical protein
LGSDEGAGNPEQGGASRQLYRLYSHLLTPEISALDMSTLIPFKVNTLYCAIPATQLPLMPSVRRAREPYFWISGTRPSVDVFPPWAEGLLGCLNSSHQVR